MDFEQKIQLSETLMVQQIDDELVILDTQSENYFGLEGSGVVFWKVLEKEHKLSKVYNRLLEQYDVEPEALKKDLTEWLRKLQEHGLIEVKL